MSQSSGAGGGRRWYNRRWCVRAGEGGGSGDGGRMANYPARLRNHTARRAACRVLIGPDPDMHTRKLW